MAGESDQTRWVGIRPTDPSEDIPVTESAPLTAIDVRPEVGCDNFPVTESAPLTVIDVNPAVGCDPFPVALTDPLAEVDVNPAAGCDDFPVTTRKRAPAIGDTLAVKTSLGKENGGFRVCTVKGEVELGPVPADEIWIVTGVSTGNFMDHSDLTVIQDVGGVLSFIMYEPSVPHALFIAKQVYAVLAPTDKMLFWYEYGGGWDWCVAMLSGYIVAPYA